ncbi:hypothetical protein CDEF62S_02396 [Castellaniella defragrans]
MGNTKVDIDWITPTTRPAMMAPRTDPNPPRTTTVNMMRMNCWPIYG